jgi:hypothetical protein
MSALKIYAIIALCIGGYIALMNWVSFFLNITHKGKGYHSPVPVVGALFLGLGLACFETTRKYALLSILIDQGTLVFIISIPWLIKEAWRTSRFCQLKAFGAKTDIVKYELILYNHKNFVLETNYNPPQIANEHGARIITSGMSGTWQEQDGVITFAETYGRSFRLVLRDGKYRIEEPSYPENKKFRHDCLDGIEFISK